MTDTNLQFARNGAKLTIEIFNLLANDDSFKNIIFSPISIQTCVALAFAGARGESAEQIVAGMRFLTDEQAEVANHFRSVLKNYEKNASLKIANKIYVQQGEQLKGDYKESVKENYYGETESINFAVNAVTADIMNTWIERKTAGKIKKIILPEHLNRDTRLVLLNALHFKCAWKKKFNAKIEGKFWLDNNLSLTMDFMRVQTVTNYGVFEELDCEALEMPFKDSDLSMMILLPKKKCAIRALAEKLENINLLDLTEGMRSVEVEAKLPKFKLDYCAELNDTLKALGITKIFTDDAEFDILESAENVHVSTVIHKVSIEINEEIGDTTTDNADDDDDDVDNDGANDFVTFEANHQFFFMIWNRKNILFAGQYCILPGLN